MKRGVLGSWYVWVGMRVRAARVFDAFDFMDSRRREPEGASLFRGSRLLVNRRWQGDEMADTNVPTIGTSRHKQTYERPV